MRKILFLAFLLSISPSVLWARDAMADVNAYILVLNSTKSSDSVKLQYAEALRDLIFTGETHKKETPGPVITSHTYGFRKGTEDEISRLKDALSVLAKFFPDGLKIDPFDFTDVIKNLSPGITRSNIEDHRREALSLIEKAKKEMKPQIEHPAPKISPPSSAVTKEFTEIEEAIREKVAQLDPSFPKDNFQIRAVNKSPVSSHSLYEIVTGSKTFVAEVFPSTEPNTYGGHLLEEKVKRLEEQPNLPQFAKYTAPLTIKDHTIALFEKPEGVFLPDFIGSALTTLSLQDAENHFERIGKLIGSFHNFDSYFVNMGALSPSIPYGVALKCWTHGNLDIKNIVYNPRAESMTLLGYGKLRGPQDKKPPSFISTDSLLFTSLVEFLNVRLKKNLVTEEKVDALIRAFGKGYMNAFDEEGKKASAHYELWVAFDKILFLWNSPYAKTTRTERTATDTAWINDWMPKLAPKAPLPDWK